jgi:hypothetical protein
MPGATLTADPSPTAQTAPPDPAALAALADGDDPFACPPPRTPARERVLRRLAALWRTLRWLWLAAALGLCLALGLGLAGIAPSPTLPPLALSAAQTAAAALATLTLLLVSWYAFAADRYLRRIERLRLAAEYVLRPVRRLAPRDYVPRYLGPVYLPRRDATTGGDADAATRAAIRAAASSARRASPSGALGICVYGPLAAGKTRLAFEVIRAELPGWTLLRWPRDPAAHPHFARLRGRRVVLWLDDIHTWATPTDGAIVADLPRRLARAGARCVVVATCPDGQDEVRTRRHLGSLLARLTPIRLAAVTAPETNQLIAALAKQGVAADGDAFDGTPGSLLLNIREMRATVFPCLSADARHALHAIKLLRSAHIYTYPEARVVAVAASLLGLDPAAWPAARAELVASGFIHVHTLATGGMRQLTPIANAYIAAIPPHLSANAELSDDWPWLLACLERCGDVGALTDLGVTFSETSKGFGPLLPYSLRNEKQHGVLCFRAALESCSLRAAPREWARAQYELGHALSARATVSEGLLRADIWRQALAAYRAALDVFAYPAEPALWALAHRGLAVLFQNRAADALFAGETLTAGAHLREARRHARCALTHYTPATDPIAHREVAALRDAVDESLRQLD